MIIPDSCDRCGLTESSMPAGVEWRDSWTRCEVGGEWTHSCERMRSTMEGQVCDEHYSSVPLALRFGGAMLYDPRARRIEREAMEQAAMEYREGRDA